MKITRRFVSFALSAIMIITTFLAVGPVFSIKADAATIKIGDYEQLDINIANYEHYRQIFFDGEGTNWPTEFVIPGLEYCTPQSVTYWAKRDWVLISAQNSNGTRHYIYALDAKSADFVALFAIRNGSQYDYLTCSNFSIAASEHNLYFISSDLTQIGYFPLSYIDIDLKSEPEQNKWYIDMAGTINFAAEFHNAPLAYCGIDDNILWMGNCYGSASSVKAYNDTYPSALMGYQLKGSSSAEEWNNLKDSSSTDCAGNPTYCVLFNNNLTDIQHASVNNGKIYILRSNSQLVSGGSVRSFDIADIDINSPGDTRLTINGKEKDCHIVSSVEKSYSGNQVLQNGEAFCIIEDYIYMFGVQAYGSNSSTAPLQMLWKVDQHKLNGVTRPDVDDDVKASHYEKVDNLSEIKEDEEYIIAYKSENKDPVTQKEIYYLLDSFGGYGGKKLPRNDSPNPDGSNTGDSIGVIGYALSDYAIDGDNLYISDEVDERKSIRWKISHSGSGSNLRLENMDFYFGNSKYFTFDYRHITMATDSNITLNNMSIKAEQNSKFSIIYQNMYYLWCNDNTDTAITEKYNEQYSSHGKTEYTPNYDKLTEANGTFHSDAKHAQNLGSGNLTDGAVDSKFSQFYIYKRVKDPYASDEGTNIRTDYNVKLNENGLYDITIGSYATSEINYYKKLSSSTKPTDFIFVMDTSDSMDAAFGKINAKIGLTVDYLAMQTDFSSTSKGDYVTGLYDNGQGPTDRETIEYYKASDGTYHPLRLAIKVVDRYKSWGTEYYTSYYWVYYERDDKIYVINNVDGKATTDGWTEGVFKSKIENEPSDKSKGTRTDQTTGNSLSSSLSSTFTNIPYYTISEGTNDDGRLGGMREYIRQMVDRIKSQDSANRIALCQFTGTPNNSTDNSTGGAFTGFFINSKDTRVQIENSYNADSSDYSDAFHNVDKQNHLNNISNIINKFNTDTPDGYGNGGGSDLSYGMYMAYKMLEKSGEDYSYDGGRHACVIVLTDGGITTDDSKTSFNDDINNIANKSIEISKKIKAMGASVYTMRIGEEAISEFDTNKFLSYLSSEYLEATDRINIGDSHPADVDYTYELLMDTASVSNYGLGFFNDVIANRLHTMARFDDSAIIREKFDTNVFSYVSDTSTVSAQKVKAYYDALGRLTFDYDSAEALTNPNIDWNSGQITANGFDYSNHYVGKDTATKDGTARKFVITIKDVAINENCANKTDPTADYVNTQVDINSYVGLYRDLDDLIANSVYKGFPSDRIRIPQYTYVLDYGKIMNDPHINGRIISIDTQMREQNPDTRTPFMPSDLDIRVNGTTFDVNDEQELKYLVTPMADGSTGAYAFIQRPNGDFDWFKLNIVPASTVYFEETVFETKANDNKAWSNNGTVESLYQDLSSDDDIYGRDSHYENSTSAYSNGTYSSATVSESEKRSNTLTTTFTGKGFDLYSVCGQNTGVQVVSVKNSSGSIVKSYVVDTYFSGETFTQVPIVKFRGDYATYTIETTAAYLPSISGAIVNRPQTFGIRDAQAVSETAEFGEIYEDVILSELGFEELIGSDVEMVYFDESSVLNGGDGAFAADAEAFTTQSDSEQETLSLENYVDGFRIYNPVPQESEIYYKESERNATYFNVIDILKSSDQVMNGTVADGITFVESTGDETIVSTYESKNAPKGELYLKSNGTDALAFSIPQWDDTMRIMISVRAAKGSPTVTINGGQYTVSSKTETYLDLTDVVNNGNISISNTSTDGSLLAINSIKFVNAPESNTFSALSDITEIENLLSMPEFDFDFGVSDSDDLPSINPDGPVMPELDSFLAKTEAFVVRIFEFFKRVLSFVWSVVN